MADTIFTNAKVFDGYSGDYPGGMSVRVSGGRIVEVSEATLASTADTQVIDVGGRLLMPGLIDAHVHAYFSDPNWLKVDRAGEAYRTAHAVRMLGFALDSGFTTVRDIGGGDYSLWRAIEDGLFRAPRYYYAGKILSMTGGHGDTRTMDESRHTHGYCSCGDFSALCVVADGVDDCIKAAREELRRGAHCIKIMASGGVTSPTDPIWMTQYREDEIRAIVEECAVRRTYVSAHCHPTDAIRRCVEFGVRVIEHGTLMDGETAALVAERGAFVVPTLIIANLLSRRGDEFGISAENQAKAVYVYDQAVRGLDSMRSAGVKLGFGTDLMGETYKYQCHEFLLRREVFEPVEILRQATSGNAAILQLENEIGCIKPGAWADLLVVDGDPLSDIAVLAEGGERLSVIMKSGVSVKNRL
jgi:imidazolonepropionase-like amidohydrolase